MHASAIVLDRPRLLQLLREDQVSPDVSRHAYVNEGSERVSRGSVTLSSGGRWFASLEVRMRDDQGALLTIARFGPDAGPAPSDASVTIPPGEADALISLLTGLMEQAREDGVLESTPGKPRRRTKPRTLRPPAPTWNVGDKP